MIEPFGCKANPGGREPLVSTYVMPRLLGSFALSVGGCGAMLVRVPSKPAAVTHTGCNTLISHQRTICEREQTKYENHLLRYKNNNKKKSNIIAKNNTAGRIPKMPPDAPLPACPCVPPANPEPPPPHPMQLPDPAVTLPNEPAPPKLLDPPAPAAVAVEAAPPPPPALGIREKVQSMK